MPNESCSDCSNHFCGGCPLRIRHVSEVPRPLQQFLEQLLRFIVLGFFPRLHFYSPRHWYGPKVNSGPGLWRR